MAKFPEAEERTLVKQICMKCNARNPQRTETCRRCGAKKLRTKAREPRNA